MSEEDYLCVGICLPDEDEAYCIGCGRPWGGAVPAAAGAVPPAPTFPAMAAVVAISPEDAPVEDVAIQRTSNSKLPPS